MKAIDVMGFAGSMAAGIDQAGFEVIAKREPTAFKGFGVESMTYNMPWVEAQVSDFTDWDLPPEPVELVYGCPPCSGFSALSIINAAVHKDSKSTLYGADADINECMQWFVDYASRVKPPVAIFESVGPAFKVGRAWMESLFYRLREQTGLDYKLYHVNMDGGKVGADVIRRRYFFVATLQPFGIGLEFVEPRSFMEVVGDIADATDEDDTDWGHYTDRGGGVARTARTIEWLEERGLEWKQGTRLPDNIPDDLEPPDFWYKERASTRSKRFDPRIYSHWFSTDAFSPLRWRADKPMGVVVAATLFRAVHPTAPRNLTYREAARFMTLPDTWSLRVLTEKNRPAELGKAVPTGAAKWIGHWAKMSIEGTPGEYAGMDTDDPNIRIITVNNRDSIARAQKGDSAEGHAFWDESITSDPDPALWLVDRKARPSEWWQRDDELGIFVPKPGDRPKRTPVRTTSRVSQAPRTIKSAPPAKAASNIDRIQPEAVQALLDDLGLSKEQAAEKLGVSVSRVRELTTHARPKSWLNAERWDQVQEVLGG